MQLNAEVACDVGGRHSVRQVHAIHQGKQADHHRENGRLPMAHLVDRKTIANASIHMRDKFYESVDRHVRVCVYT